MINKENFNEINTRRAKEEFLGTVKCALYYDMLQTAFGPKEGDSDMVRTEKDAKLKLMMKKDVESSQFYNMIDQVMNTKFGKRFASELFGMVTDPALHSDDYKGVIDHANIIRIRDDVLKTCFTEEMDKYSKYLADSEKQLDKMYNEKNRHNDIRTKLDEVNKAEESISNLINLSESISSKALENAKETFRDVKKAFMDRNAARENARNERKAKAGQLRNNKPKVQKPQGPANHM